MAHFLLLKMSPSFWAMLNKFMMLASWMANTPGHWATMSSILIWKISCDILSLKGTHRNLPSEVGVEHCEE